MFDWLKVNGGRVAEMTPKNGDLRVVKRTYGSGKEAYFLEIFISTLGQWLNLLFYIVNGKVERYSPWRGLGDGLALCYEGLDDPKLLCEYIKEQEQVKLRGEFEKQQRAVVKTEVVKCECK